MNALEIITYIHIIGVALGFGGAMVGDAMFFSSIRDKKFTTTELRFMKLGGKLIWLGIAILIASGIGLVYITPELLQSSKFLTKMVIVAVIIVNGVIFHGYHIPNIHKNLNKSTKTTPFFQKKGYLLTMSGGVSVVSWLSAAFLGSLSWISLSFLQLLGIYGVLLLLALGFGALLKKVVFN